MLEASVRLRYIPGPALLELTFDWYFPSDTCEEWLCLQTQPTPIRGQTAINSEYGEDLLALDPRCVGFQHFWLAVAPHQKA